MTRPGQPPPLLLRVPAGKRCGRPLRDLVSRARGYGPVCWGRVRGGRPVPMVLPGMPGSTRQEGPDLLTTQPAEAPASAPEQLEPVATAVVTVPVDPGTQVWIAAARRGITAHALFSGERTRCGRSTRTGLTLPAGQAAERFQASWCTPCWSPQPKGKTK